MLDLELNPRAKTVKVGVRKLIPVNIYPLSFGDELLLFDIFSDAITGFMNLPSIAQTTERFGTLLGKLIKDHVETITALVIDKDEWVESSRTPSDDFPKSFLKSVDNVQMAEIVDAVYENNFKVIEKKIQGALEIFQKIRSEGKEEIDSESMNSSPPFSEATPNIPTGTSLREDSGTGD